MSTIEPRRRQGIDHSNRHLHLIISPTFDTPPELYDWATDEFYGRAAEAAEVAQIETAEFLVDKPLAQLGHDALVGLIQEPPINH